MSTKDGWWVPEAQRLVCPNCSKRTRQVEMIVIHTTVCPRQSPTNIERITRWITNKGNASTHFVVLRDGTVLQGVKTTDCAWHAGSSEWTTSTGHKITSSVNQWSIGIDLDNVGRLTDKGGKLFDCYGGAYTGQAQRIDGVWVEPFTSEQMAALTRLVATLQDSYKIPSADVVGHVHVSPGRKTDPDKGMPWDMFYAILAAGSPAAVDAACAGFTRVIPYEEE